MDLYLWNARVSAAAFEDLGVLEIAVRNACSRQLGLWHAESGACTPWYYSTALQPRHMQDVSLARVRVQNGKRPETEGRVVSELTFGFWRLLHSKVYEPSLWQHALRFAYPTASGLSRGTVYGHLDHLNTLRNRVAHHEPVHGQTIGTLALDLAALHGELLEAASWIDLDLAGWLTTESRVPALLVTKP